jgi:hypothetical protein
VELESYIYSFTIVLIKDFGYQIVCDLVTAHNVSGISKSLLQRLLSLTITDISAWIGNLFGYKIMLWTSLENLSHGALGHTNLRISFMSVVYCRNKI